MREEEALQTRRRMASNLEEMWSKKSRMCWIQQHVRSVPPPCSCDNEDMCKIDARSEMARFFTCVSNTSSLELATASWPRS